MDGFTKPNIPLGKIFPVLCLHAWLNTATTDRLFKVTLLRDQL